MKMPTLWLLENQKIKLYFGKCVTLQYFDQKTVHFVKICGKS